MHVIEFSRDLEKDVRKELRSHFEKFIVGLLQAKREELSTADIEKMRRHGMQSVVDMKQVMTDVKSIYDDGEG